jgi:acyl carrier protein
VYFTLVGHVGSATLAGRRTLKQLTGTGTRHQGNGCGRMTHDEVVGQLKKLLAERLRVPRERAQALALDAPLLKDGLGLDSLDCVELTLGIEEVFGLVFDDSEENWLQHFACLDTLSKLVLTTKGESA